MTKSQNCQFSHMAQRAMLHLDMKIQGLNPLAELKCSYNDI